MPPQTQPEAGDRAPRRPLIHDDGRYCVLRVYTEEQWHALPHGRRPARWTHALGLGYVAAVPIDEAQQ